MRLQVTTKPCAEPGHCLLDGQGGAHGALRVVAVGDGSAEHPHDTIADVLVDGPAMALDGAIDRFKECAKQAMDLFRIQVARQPGEPHKIGEQDRHLPTVAFSLRWR